MGGRRLVLVYRVFPHLASVSDPTVPGHPLYLHRPQLGGRWDNPVHYDAWYFAKSPECAIGETFAGVKEWSNDMFDFPWVPGSRRSLGVFDLPDSTPLLDLDDATALARRGVRPSKVVSPNRSSTQVLALSMFEERHAHGARLWSGLQWWSQLRPQWDVLVVWVEIGQPIPHDVVKVEDLDLGHPAVGAAAKALVRRTI